MKKVFYLLVICSLFTLPITSQTKETKKELKEKKAQEDFESIKKIIDSKMYEFNADWIRSTGNRINIASGSNNLIVSKDSTNAAMQYFGTVTSIGFSGSEGVNFDNKILDYKVDVVDSKKKKITISYNVKNKSETYNVYMTVFKSGVAYVDIYSNSKTNVTYEGNIVALKAK